MRYFFGLFLCIVSLVFVPADFSFASNNNSGLSVGPAYLDISLEKPDEEKEFEITYLNNSNKPIELEFFALDFKQADPRGTVGFITSESGSYNYSLASFVELQTNTFQLEPGEKKKLEATVKNRFDLTPGGHYGAIIAKVISSKNENNSQSTVISPAISTLIYLRKVGGERFNLSIKDSDFPKLPFVFRYPDFVNLTFQNDGNTHLSPYGILTVKDMFGRTTHQGSINETSFKVLPESRRYIKGYLSRVSYTIPLSFSQFEVVGQDSLNKTKFIYRGSFIYINPMVVFIPIGMAVLFKLRKRNKKNQTQN